MTTVRDVGPPPVGSWPPRACEGARTELFFPSRDGTNPGADVRAKEYCRRCLALEECRAYALPITDLAGVWSGMNQSERERARKQQKEEA